MNYLNAGAKDLDLIKLNNGSLLAEQLAKMDQDLKKVLGNRRYGQLQFSEIRSKFLVRYELYQQVQTKSQQIMSKESPMVDLEKNC